MEFWKPRRRVWFAKNDDKKLARKPTKREIRKAWNKTEAAQNERMYGREANRYEREHPPEKYINKLGEEVEYKTPKSKPLEEEEE